VIDTITASYRVQEVIDYSALEHEDTFLEGAGAMVLDHLDRVTYTARSNRAIAYGAFVMWWTMTGHE
jgi:hypothetical protein